MSDLLKTRLGVRHRPRTRPLGTRPPTPPPPRHRTLLGFYRTEILNYKTTLTPVSPRITPQVVLGGLLQTVKRPLFYRSEVKEFSRMSGFFDSLDLCNHTCSRPPRKMSLSPSRPPPTETGRGVGRKSTGVQDRRPRRSRRLLEAGDTTDLLPSVHSYNLLPPLPLLLLRFHIGTRPTVQRGEGGSDFLGPRADVREVLHTSADGGLLESLESTRARAEGSDGVSVSGRLQCLGPWDPNSDRNGDIGFFIMTFTSKLPNQ